MAVTVVTHVIMFIAVLGIASGLLVAIKNYADETEGTFSEKSDSYNQIIKTDINIDLVHYNNNTNTTHVYVRNTGSTKMDRGKVDIYIDGVYVPRNSSNRTVEVASDTEVVSPGVWDPRELLHIQVPRKLSDEVEHEVIVVTPYTVRATDTFSI